MTISTRALTGLERMQYETPPGGITLTGYIARRMQKTRLLNDLDVKISSDDRLALAQFGYYAIAAATSFGPALYQPRFDGPGSVVREVDPETQASIMVEQLPKNPHYSFKFSVDLPGIGMVNGNEQILGTTVSLRGLGMPAPSQFSFKSADGAYKASAVGVIKSELAPGLGRWRVRGYGELVLEDNSGNQGQLILDRKGQVRVEVTAQNGHSIQKVMKIS